MEALPPRALSLAGFALGHAAWSVSDLTDAELLCPLAVLERAAGERRLLRFEAETQKDAIALWKRTLADQGGEVAAWAFAREGKLQAKQSDEEHDALMVEFWAAPMASPATLIQRFERFNRHGRFRVLGRPIVVVSGKIVDTARDGSIVETIRAGVTSHTQVAALWPLWEV